MSVTAVPLQPIRRGSVRRFWLAVVLVLAVAAVLAWAGSRQFGHTASGLRYQMITQGSGESPTRDDFALVAYKGTLPDGTVFDENESAPMDLQSLVPGFAEAVTLLKRGGSIRAWIPAELAYGDSPPPGGVIPPNTPLQFEIKLLEFKTRAEVMQAQQMMQMQQMMQQQGGGPGAPGAMPPGAPEMPQP
ncbi:MULTISPECIES: FKBP-type peptidyl-prolyl cis-trans isomerase [unclassified Sphingobium]|uniref:FKBP-type peptidyl-prolyl cis-trans isomerase n=1 Tax=unclassified Sphingobium TaxID=2611147 RepID=UPI0022259E2C|nr:MULTISPECIES: FKBP-type peptidyl-prolyl cis-trans isomerase [unclassified Sphingobium]MCW2368949.1 FKBP-type peptidyl-prolyl cis-trans isomerase FkpA [Sphingobium sp. B11D3D]MCW2393939.1 FKBP-type peptidyl-prolyl cis-trans isomerase FkpA [Sphingobium sp. B8D3B]MCW2417453.1 FKBP-type peptidyl-prolyl cis-trans isomerase FkpA [Sphingobium sp. B8D3C]